MSQHPSTGKGKQFLVAGVSGHFARAVVSNLIDVYGIAPERIAGTTRTPEKVADLAARGVDIRHGDYAAPETMRAACGDVEKVFLTPTMLDPAPGRSRGDVQVDAVQAVADAGVEHIFYASAPGAEPRVPAAWHLDHHLTERALVDSGHDWTILRNWEWPVYYYQWFGWKQSLRVGEHHTFSGQSVCSFVSREDCAAAAAGALVSGTSRNRRFDLTGPAEVSIDEVFDIVHRVTGRRVTVHHETQEEWEAWCKATGLSEARVDGDRSRQLMQLGGWYSGLSNGVEQLTGRAPLSLEGGLRILLRGV